MESPVTLFVFSLRPRVKIIKIALNHSLLKQVIFLLVIQISGCRFTLK